MTMATEGQLLRRRGGLRSLFASIGAVLLWCSLCAMMAAAAPHRTPLQRQDAVVQDNKEEPMAPLASFDIESGLNGANESNGEEAPTKLLEKEGLPPPDGSGSPAPASPGASSVGYPPAGVVGIPTQLLPLTSGQRTDYGSTGSVGSPPAGVVGIPTHLPLTSGQRTDYGSTGSVDSLRGTEGTLHQIDSGPPGSQALMKGARTFIFGQGDRRAPSGGNLPATAPPGFLPDGSQVFQSGTTFNVAPGAGFTLPSTGFAASPTYSVPISQLNYPSGGGNPFINPVVGSAGGTPSLQTFGITNYQGKPVLIIRGTATPGTDGRDRATITELPPSHGTPEGTTPQGTTPQGTTPQGTTPQGTTSQGTTSQGTPQGTPQGTFNASSYGIPSFYSTARMPQEESWDRRSWDRRSSEASRIHGSEEWSRGSTDSGFIRPVEACGSEQIEEAPTNGFALPSSDWIRNSIANWHEMQKVHKATDTRNFFKKAFTASKCSRKVFVKEMFRVYTQWANEAGAEVGDPAQEKSEAAQAMKLLIESAAKHSKRTKVGRFAKCLPSFFRKVYERYLRRRKCQTTKTNPIWSLIDDVDMCGPMKYVVCGKLQHDQDRLRINSRDRSLASYNSPFETPPENVSG